jgi:rod shape-determining protein MreC
LRGTPLGEVVLEKVMSDETVAAGERVLTSGGDQIFPKGLPVGTVTKVSPGSELFLNIRVKPAVDLNRLEEVLVITQQEEKEPALAAGEQSMRAADILAQRLPSVPDRPPDDPNKPPPPTSGLKILPAPTAQSNPGAAATTNSKPSLGATKAAQASPTNTVARPQAGSAGAAIRPAIDSSTMKPTVKPPAVKPVTQKPVPPAVTVSEDAANAAASAGSASSKPNPQPDQPAPPPPPQEQPH